jgi:hypothetical protein
MMQGIDGPACQTIEIGVVLARYYAEFPVEKTQIKLRTLRRPNMPPMRRKQ